MFPPSPKIRVKKNPISAIKKSEKKYLYCRGVYFTF